jgi:hypothetical protein
MFMAKSGGNFIELAASTGQNRIYFLNNGVEISTGTFQTNIVMGSTHFRFFQNTVQFTNTLQTASGTNTFLIQNGTAPSANRTSHHWYYSADAGTGNAAPHFRTENGDIVKLYRVAGWGLPTGTFTRTTFDTATVTTAQLAERVAALIQDLRDNHQLLKA